MKKKIRRFVLPALLLLTLLMLSQQIFAAEIARGPVRRYYPGRVVERYYEPRPYVRYNVSPYRRYWRPYRRTVVDVRPGDVYLRGPRGSVDVRF